MISLILGPMFSGKSTELLRQTRRYQHTKKCILIKYVNDNRYSESEVITHDGIKIHIETILGHDLNDLDLNKFVLFDVIAIDECQFMKNLTDFCEKLADMGKIVLCAGLDGDYKRNAFDEIIKLMPKCESIIKLSAVCACGKDASFTKIMIKTDKIENIGGADLYKAVCRTCYF